MKNFEEFKAALKNGEFKAEMEELSKTAKDKAEHENETLICEFAKKMGYDVSVEDLAAEKAAAQEMSDDEVEAVAGGGVPCFTPHWCATVINCLVVLVPY